MGVDRSIPGVDLYLELEVGPEATTDEIEAAYRALMKRHHPDRAGPEGLARSKRLNLARDWLVDPDRRARYDASRDVPRVDSGSTRRDDGRASPASGVAAGHHSSGHDRPEHAWRTPGGPVALVPAGTAARLGLVGVVAVLAASSRRRPRIVSVRAHGTGSPGALGDTSSTPTVEPTPDPDAGADRGPHPRSDPRSDARTDPTTQPAPTPTPAAPPAGRADIRFSGMYTEHVVQSTRRHERVHHDDGATADR